MVRRKRGMLLNRKEMEEGYENPEKWIAQSRFDSGSGSGCQ